MIPMTTTQSFEPCFEWQVLRRNETIETHETAIKTIDTVSITV